MPNFSGISKKLIELLRKETMQNYMNDQRKVRELFLQDPMELADDSVVSGGFGNLRGASVGQDISKWLYDDKNLDFTAPGYSPPPPYRPEYKKPPPPVPKGPGGVRKRNYQIMADLLRKPDDPYDLDASFRGPAGLTGTPSTQGFKK